MTIPQSAVQAVLRIIHENPCVLDFDDESLWEAVDNDSSVNTDAFNSIQFGDGTRENTVSEYGLWRFEEKSKGSLKTIFEVFHRIKDILVTEGVPEEYFVMQYDEPLFEGYEIRDYKRLKPKNPALNTLEDLYQILTHCWKAETAYPDDQKDWSEDVPSYGQCAITAMLVYDRRGIVPNKGSFTLLQSN